MFPSFSSPCSHECCSHCSVFSLGKAVKAQMEMPAHKAPFFSVSKLMSMNHRLIGKSVPIPELLFLLFSPLCSLRGAQPQELSPPAKAGPHWPYQTQRDLRHRPEPTVLRCHARGKHTNRLGHSTPPHTQVCTHTSQGLVLLVFVPIPSLSD